MSSPGLQKPFRIIVFVSLVLLVLAGLLVDEKSKVPVNNLQFKTYLSYFGTPD